MNFGYLPIEKAEGAILAHSLNAAGRKIRKGRVLTAADIGTLKAAGIDSVMAARLEAGDYGEDAAAGRLAAAGAGGNITPGTAGTGRCNLYSATKGLLIVARERADAFNQVDEAVTLSTLPPYQEVEDGDLVATVKIIPLGVPGATVDKCAAIAAAGPLLRVAAFRPFKAALLQTLLPGAKDKLVDKMVQVTRARLAASGGELVDHRTCAHTEAEAAAALGDMAKSGCDVILVLGGSAIVDRRDVVPAAVVRAGGAIEHFGMPVDPGNLMLLASLGNARVLGLPGSARSPRLHGFDWVLQRIAAGEPVGGKDIMAMGVGGLLREMPGRPLPRLRAAPPSEAPEAGQPSDKIAALILAAGRSRRMGPVNKLLAEVDGVAMVRRTAEAVLAAAADPVIVVTGHQDDSVRRVLDSLTLRFVHNPDFADGLSTSLRAGLGALPEGIDGVLVCLGDMPRVRTAHLNQLIAAFDSLAGREICVPTFHGKRGNPVLLGRKYFTEMRALEGDVGARHLIGEHGDVAVEIEMTDDAVLVDVDTPEALADLTSSAAKG